MAQHKEFPILYKYTSKGQPQQWQIVAEDDKFYTIEGIVGGKLTTSLPTICTGKNIGRANETTAEQQALLEAAAKHQKKLDKGYNETITTEKKFFEPMLAKDFKDVKIDDFSIGIYVQPKLDGLRCISQNKTKASRNGKPYVSVPHLYQSDALLDGELYNHEFKDNFNKIVSLCKKAKPTALELDESMKLVQYWVYDYPEIDGPFSTRYKALQVLFKNNNYEQRGYVLVPTYKVHSHEEIEAHHERFLADGYEGTIVRIDSGSYENKRSKQLLKFKDFKDEEFEIVDVIEGEGQRTGTVGKFMMRLEDGRTFGSNVKGEFSYLRELLITKDQLIGRRATVKYFNRTPDGVPRFPYVIKIDRESYE